MVLVDPATDDEEGGDELQSGHGDPCVGEEALAIVVVYVRLALGGESAAEEDGGEEKAEERREFERREQVSLEHADVAGGRASVFYEEHGGRECSW